MSDAKPKTDEKPTRITFRLSLINGEWSVKETDKASNGSGGVQKEFNEAVHAFKELQNEMYDYPEPEGILGWYWKRLLLAVPDLVRSLRQHSTEIRISQVAESVLVCVLQNGKLIQSPTFSRVSRLTRRDQLSVYQDYFHDEVIDEVRSIRAKNIKSKVKKKRALQYVLGRNDVVYSVVGHDGQLGLKHEDDGIEISLEPKINLHPFKESINFKIRRENQEKFLHYPWNIVKLPPPNNSVSIRKPQKILLSSRCLRYAFEKVSEIWNDPTVKSVLLVAPPGSGKEIIAEAIYRGCRKSGPFQNMSVAGQPLKNISESLFGSEPPSKGWPNTANAEGVGLVGKSMGGVLFLDEIDKTEDDRVRAMLLRVLEQDSYVIPGKNLLVKLDPRPLYIFAGSKPIGEMYSLGPSDFWTRISHVIELQHPLDSDDLETRKSVCKNYFGFFWLEHIPKLFREAKLISDDSISDPTIGLIHEYCSGPFEWLISERTVENLSEVFAEEMNLESGPPPSIRNIRSLARRVAFEMVELVLYDKDPEKSWRDKKPLLGGKNVFEQLLDRFPKRHLGSSEVNHSQAIFEKVLRRIITKSISGIT